MSYQTIHSFAKSLALTALALMALGGGTTYAAPVIKSATGTDLAAGASWGGTAPGAADTATWNSTSLGAALTLDSNASWGGIVVTSVPTDIGITGAGALTLGASGIDMSTAAKNLTVANNLSLDAAQTWNVNTSRSLIISGIISGSHLVTKSGAGTLTLNALNNAHNGGMIVNAGSVTTAATGNTTDTYFGTGSLTVNSGATLALNRTYIGNALTLNNATVTAGNSFGSTLAGSTTLAGNSTISVTGNLTISGNMTGSGGLIKTGSAVVPVSGTNNYTGTTTINGGGLTFTKAVSLYNADSAQWTKSNIIVNSGGSLIVKIGGTGEFTTTQASTIFGNLVDSVNSNGLQAGAIFGVDASTTAGNYTISTNLTDSVGTGGGAVGFRFFGNGTIGASTLELTGSNTYSGQTIIDRHGVLKVSSINSVFTNPALGTVHSSNSSLGAPTTVPNGTIQLGTSASFQGSGLLYTGTGETTDRVISMGGGGNDTYRFDQSGTGHLKFLSNMVMTDSRGTKTIVLQGSTVGTGEMAGVIPNPTTGNPPLNVTKSGTGTWTLSAANYYVGITTLTAGTLSVSTISDGGLTPTLTTTASSATVIASSTAGLVAGQTVISPRIPVGATIAAIVDSTTFTLNSGTGVTAGTSQASNIAFRSNLGTAPAAATNLVFNGGTLQYTGANASTNRNFTINTGKVALFDITANHLTLTGASTATNGALTKTGLGTLTLAGANLATGATTVNQGTLAITGSVTSTSGVNVNSGGTLLVNNTSGSGTGNAAVTVNSGGSLGGSGTINGTVTVNAGGSLTLGNSGNTLLLATATSPTFNAFGSLKVNAATNTLDKVSLTNSAANFACGNLDLVVDTTDLARAFSAVEIVRTAKANGVTGTFRSVSVIGNPAYAATVTYSANSITLTLSGGSSTLPAAYKIQVAGNDSATTSAGSGVNLTITALDAFGATLSGFSGDVDLSFYGLASSPNNTAATVSDKTGVAKTATPLVGTPNTTITFSNGIATTTGANNGVLSAYNATGSPVTVHCSDGFASSVSGVGAAGLSLTVNPAAIASYAVSAGSTQGNGATFVTTVIAKDAYGNTVTTDSSTLVTMSSSTGNAQFDSDGNGTFGDNTKTLSAGSFSIHTRNDIVETLTLTATSGGGQTGTSSPITIATSSAKDILTFTFPTWGAATISGTNIGITVPFGTSLNLAPTYTLSTLATCSPASGSTQNFSTPQTYTVTAQDLSTKVYTVTVTVAPEATTFTWNSASSGNWSIASNWTNNSGLVLAPNASGSAKYSLNFPQAGTYTPAHDLNNNFQLNQLNLAATVTISGNSLAFAANGPTLPQINQNSSSAIALSAPLVLNANLTFGGSGNGTVALSSNVSGTGSLTKACSGNMTLTGTNSHSGGTIISTGTLTLGGTANTLLGTGPVTLASGCTLALNGNNNLTNSFALNGGTVTNGNSFSANLNGPISFGAINTFDLATTGNMTLGGAITGSGGLIKLGTSNGPLVLTGQSSFTGPVTISAGVLRVSSLNSISGGTAASNLGAPTTVADGTISLGSASTTATLIYNGPGETTDRVIRLSGTTGGATLNQSGIIGGQTTTRGVSGLLKFTSDLSVPGTAGVDNRKTLTLTSTANGSIGSMPGSGEIAGSISDSIAGISAAQRATSVTKAGPNTWILSGNNTYTGTTTIQAGVLAFTRPAALGGGALTISTGAKARLDYIGTRQVSSLTLNGISQSNGTYGSSSSAATNKNDAYFSGPGTVTVGPVAGLPTVALVRTSGTNPSNGGASVTFTASVTGNTPTGLVSFYDGITQIGSVALNGSFQASFTTSLLTSGVHTITAVYGGDGNNGIGYSAGLAHTVNDSRSATTTTLALSSGGNPSAFGASVTYTATVSGSAASGSVAFYDGSILIGTIVLNGSSQAALSTNGLAVGWRPLRAAYLGDATNAPSSSSTLFHLVNPPAGNGKTKVFILAGQSNMQGKAAVEIGRNPNNPNDTNFSGGYGSLRYMLNKSPNQYGYLADPANPAGSNPGWIKRSDVSVIYWSGGGANDVPNPANPARTGDLDPFFGNNGEGPTGVNGRIGPDYSFGLVVGSQLGDPVLILKYAFGGKSLAGDFRPPSAVANRGGTVGAYYNGMLARVSAALSTLPADSYEIAGFGWHQGWNDRSSTAFANEYEDNLVDLIRDLRAAWNSPNLPITIGTTGMANADQSADGVKVINAQTAVANYAVSDPKYLGNVVTVDTRPYDYGNDVGGNNDGYHWNQNAESYFNVGEQMALRLMTILPSQSSAKNILSFSIPGQLSSSISGNVITVTVPAGMDRRALAPSFTVSSLATALPLSGVTRDFTLPQTYTVTAQNLSTQTYTVNFVESASAYATWASTNAPSGTAADDFDGDGVSNAVEFVLGGSLGVNDLSRLPVASTSGNDMLFTFYRAQSSIDAKTSLNIEVSTNLTNWNAASSPYAVPDGAAANNPGVTVEKNNHAAGTDKVTLRIPMGSDAGKFGRLKVLISP
jgi:fibronectin-binding autotransporter adhesin